MGGSSMGIFTHAGLYVFVLEPITERLLGKLKHLKGTSEDRWTRMKMLAFAWAVLLAIAAATTWFSQMNEGPNFYQTLGCDRQASAREMKRAHRQLSLALHPDKNPSPDAEKQFRQLSFAYKNLADPRRRARYDVLGLDGVVNPTGATAAVEDSSLLTNILAYYVVGAIFSYFFTSGQHLRRARGWIYSAKAALMCVELSMMFEGAVVLPSWLPVVRFLTPHDQIEISRSFILGCEYAFCAVSRHLFAEDVRNDDRWVEKRLRVVRKALDAKHLMRAISRAVRGGYRRNEIASLRKVHAGAGALAAATAAGAPAAVAALLREGQVDAAILHCARAIENEQKAKRPVTPLCFVAMAEAHECELNANRERTGGTGGGGGGGGGEEVAAAAAHPGVVVARQLRMLALLAGTREGDHAFADEVRAEFATAVLTSAFSYFY